MKPIQLATPIKVWYKPLPKLPKAFWPIIDIKLSFKDKVLPQLIFALIDSGSSHSVLHPEIIDNPNLIWPPILGEDTIFQVSRLDFQKFKGYLEIRFRQDIN